MSRMLIFIYGLFAYAVGLGGLVWFILFVGAWGFMPQHINSGTVGAWLPATGINIGLLLLFGLQHSVMARDSFKQRLTQFIPAAAERSSYVLLSGVLMALFCLYWQALEGYVWHFESAVVQAILVGGYVLGWFIAVLATFLINHFELFGLQQVYCNLRQQPTPPIHFTERFLYKVVRHPLQFGVLIGLWSTPSMSYTHLMLAVGMSLYIFIGLHFEEKDLSATLGKDYDDYKDRVRMIVPLPK